MSADREAAIRAERDYIERTIATVRNHRGADNCWPQWANIFADEIEACWAELAAARRELKTADIESQRLEGLIAAAREREKEYHRCWKEAEQEKAGMHEGNEKLREALRFYAEQSNWGITRRADGSPRVEFLTVNEPPFERARAALSEGEG